jgi:GTP cyclohydrolase I
MRIIGLRPPLVKQLLEEMTEDILAVLECHANSEGAEVVIRRLEVVAEIRGYDGELVKG